MFLMIMKPIEGYTRHVIIGTSEKTEVFSPHYFYENTQIHLPISNIWRTTTKPTQQESISAVGKHKESIFASTKELKASHAEIIKSFHKITGIKNINHCQLNKRTHNARMRNAIDSIETKLMDLYCGISIVLCCG